MAITSTDSFVHAIREHQLLDRTQLDELSQDLLARFASTRDLAKELLERGWLTPYQVNQLAQEKGQQLLLGSYVLLERLGEGGMGTVFKARHRKLNRIVALKVIRKERLARADAVRRFHHEVRAAAQLSHPNVVHAFDADQIGDTHVLVMEYVEGTDLAKRVRDHGPLPVREACDFVRQAALGLQHAHERGLIHRDIKPANLLLMTQGTVVKILDMGLARFQRSEGAETDSSTLTQEGAVMGSLDYIAPEQALDSRAVDIRADLYSLGCTFYFLLTGQVPFPGGEALQKLMKHQQQEAVRVEQLRPEVPGAVAAIIRTLMAKRPEDRYQTPAELVAALMEFQDSASSRAADGGLPSDAPPIDPGLNRAGRATALASAAEGDTVEAIAARRQRQQAAQRRQVLLAGGSGLLVLAGLGLLLFLVSGRLRGPNQPPPANVPPPMAESSPLDRLDPAKIPAVERYDWQPKELVALIGDHRLRQWGSASGVVFRPDGRVIASCGDDKIVRLWDAASLRQQTALVGHTGTIVQLAFSPDGKMLASGSIADATVRLWKLTTDLPGQTTIIDVKGNNGAVALAFLDRKTLAIGTGKDLGLWDVSGEKPMRKALVAGEFVALACTPDATSLASGRRDGMIQLWDLTGPDPRESAVLKRHKGPIRALAYTADGKTLVSSASNENGAMWDLIGPHPQTKGELPAGGSAIALSGHGTTIALGGRSTISLWDLTGAQLRKRTQFTGAGDITSMAFAPDGTTLAAATSCGIIGLWDLRAAVPRERAGRNQWQVSSFWQSLAFAPKDGTLARGLSSGTLLWNLTRTEPREQAILNTGANGIAFAPDGKTLAVAPYASGSQHWIVRQWQLTAGAAPHELAPLKGHEGYLTAVAYTSDGKMLASSSNDKTIRLWGLQGSQPQELAVLRGHRAGVTGLALAPDGKTLASAGGSDRTVRLWDLTKMPPEEKVVLRSHVGVVAEVAFSPDSKTLASAGDDHTVRLWDLGGDKVPTPRVLKGHSSYVKTLGYAPDGKRLASSGPDGRVILWDPVSGEKVREWQLSGPVSRIAFAPDSRHLAIANGNGTVYILRLPPG